MRFLFLLPALACAQPILDHGAEVFAKTCASPYCHGPKGAGAGGPRLSGRGFDEAYISSVVRAGVPGTAMQGYGTRLARPEFGAVVAYVASLNGIPPRIAETESRPLSPEAARGRQLFSDPVRGFARCSTCHQAGDVGIAIAPMEHVPDTLRGIATPGLRTAILAGDRFPALIVSQGGRRTSVYDLSTLPPVLRSADAREFRITPENSWRHDTSLAGYTDQDLKSILVFLRAVPQAGSR